MNPTSPLTTRLRAAGYRLTPARLAVLAVVETSHAHLTPALVLDEAKTHAPQIGRATVYRTLELLTELGVLRPIYLGDGGVYFIRAEGGHHHLVCTGCGQMVEFDECMAEEMIHDLQERFGFQIDSHLLEFHGRCPACAVYPVGAAG
ncbi:MAG: transcriptional repressor [Chloroflexi bacterium]|nr:transcriptional repressor [Chloroflexota bacterium]